MTHFLEDVLRQPVELLRVMDMLKGPCREDLASVADAIRGAHHVYLTGIGASWNAALAAGTIFYAGGVPVYMQDASELLQYSRIPSGAVILALSRSGRSVEIVKLLAKARAANATVIGITNFAEGLLAQESDIPIVIPVGADHGISVNTYSALAAGAGAIAATVTGTFDDALVAALSDAIADTARRIPGWQRQLAGARWFQPGASYYFLARGSSLASAFEAALLWEEGVKSPATAMGTGVFRHGPQEVVTKDVRFAIWIDNEQMRKQDLAVAHDLKSMGASVMLIGQDLPSDAGELVIPLAPSPTHWQFLTDIFPVQLAADHLAELSGKDCDSFRFASYVVDDDHGLFSNGIEASVPGHSTLTEKD